MELATNGRTSNQDIIAIDIASSINKLSGGAVIAPWEVQHLPAEWIEVIRAMTKDLPTMKAGIDKQQEIVAKWKRDHPTYRGK